MPSLQFKCAQPIHSMADPQGSGRALITVDLDDAEALYVLSRLQAMYPDAVPAAQPIAQMQRQAQSYPGTEAAVHVDPGVAQSQSAQPETGIPFHEPQSESMTGRTEPQRIDVPQETKRPSRR